jgi:hypothetical protein
MGDQWEQTRTVARKLAEYLELHGAAAWNLMNAIFDRTPPAGAWIFS